MTLPLELVNNIVMLQRPTYNYMRELNDVCYAVKTLGGDNRDLLGIVSMMRIMEDIPDDVMNHYF